jgi:hypothetical protein
MTKIAQNIIYATCPKKGGHLNQGKFMTKHHTHLCFMDSYQRAIFFFVTLLFLINCCYCTLLNAQTTTDISGTVTNAETGEPIRGARVFLAETSIGAITTSTGSFTLRRVPAGTYQITASSLGYSTRKEPLTVAPQSSSNIRPSERILSALRLSPKAVQLERIEVTAQRDNSCADYLDRLSRMLLGTTPNAQRSRILNPEVIRCSFDKSNGQRTVRFEADEALIIDNNALGYRIRYHLDNVGLYVYPSTDGSASEWFIGTIEFEEMLSKDSNQVLQWQQRRAETFHGSFRYFLCCLLDGSWRKAGFDIHSIDYPDRYLSGKGPGGKTRVDSITVQSISSMTKRLDFPGTIEVITQKGKAPEQEFKNFAQSTVFAQSAQRTSLLLPKSSAMDVLTQGVLKRPTDITFHGYWSWQRLSDELPLNYTPSQILKIDSAKNRDTDISEIKRYEKRTVIDSNTKEVLFKTMLNAYTRKDFSAVIAILDTVLAFSPQEAEAYYYRGMAALNLGDKKRGCKDCLQAYFFGYTKAQQAIERFCSPPKIVQDSLKTYRTENVVVEAQTLQSKEAWNNLRALMPHIHYTATQLGANTQRRTATVLDASSVDSQLSREQELAPTDYDCQASAITSSRASRFSLQCIGKLIKEQANQTSDKEIQASARRIEYLIRDIYQAENQNRATLILYLRSEFAAFVALLL